MKRGFTLLELIIVIIILGILATLGIQQYMKMIERSRGAEAKTVLGQIRTTGAAFRLETGTLTNFDNAHAGIGTTADSIPSACAETHYFSYTVTTATGNNLVGTATRCGATGKGAATPGAGGTLILNTEFNTGVDDWIGNGGY